MGRLGGAEWLIIALLVALLFGAKRLPDAARGLGRSLRIFKAETRGLFEDGREPNAGASAGSAAPQVQPAAAQPIAEPTHRSETPPQA